MDSLVLVSKKVLEDYEVRIAEVLRSFGPRYRVAPFDAAAGLPHGNVDALEIAFFSRDVWEGTTRSKLSPAAEAFWSVVDHAPNLEWVQVGGAGADQAPYQASIQRGVRLTVSSGANTTPVALTAFTGLMMLARGFPHWMDAQRARRWAPVTGASEPRDIEGQTAVIVGTGNIGSTIARCLRTVGATTVGVRREAIPAEPFDRIVGIGDLDALLPSCDWLVLACPLTDETRGLVTRNRLSLLPRHAHVINVARGEVIDEPALVASLQTSAIAGAYLDVFAREPLPEDSPLWTLSNVIVSPHNSAASRGNYGRGVEIFLDNLGRYLSGRALRNEVIRSS